MARFAVIQGKKSKLEGKTHAFGKHKNVVCRTQLVETLQYIFHLQARYILQGQAFDTES